MDSDDDADFYRLLVYKIIIFLLNEINVCEN